MIDLGLTGRSALVTGAASGIGLAVARWLAGAGCDIAVVDRDGDALTRAVALIETEGPRVVPITADVRDEGRVTAMVNKTVAELGGLDVAVNNVGSLAGLAAHEFLDQDSAYVVEVVSQNLFVTASCCRAEGQAMVAAGRGGVILNVSSGESTRPALRLAAYGAAKAAINHLTQTLAVELGPFGIRVNAVAPGTTLTETVRPALSDEYLAALVTSIPLGRLNEPDDLGRPGRGVGVGSGTRRDRPARPRRQRRAPFPQPASARRLVSIVGPPGSHRRPRRRRRLPRPRWREGRGRSVGCRDRPPFAAAGARVGRLRRLRGTPPDPRHAAAGHAPPARAGRSRHRPHRSPRVRITVSAVPVGLVTGSASGIGEATARHLARDGFEVVCCDIDDDVGRDAARSIGATYRSLDVGDPAAWAELEAELRREGRRVTRAVLNAGMLTSVEPVPFLDVSAERYRRVRAVNLDGVVLGIQAVARLMTPARWCDRRHRVTRGLGPL